MHAGNAYLLARGLWTDSRPADAMVWGQAD